MGNSIKEVVHESAKDLHKHGFMDDETMKELDKLCLPEVKKYTPEQIKKIRLRNKVTQALFATYLNTSLSTIQKWERGYKKPNNLSLKLLNLVDSKGISILI